MNLVYHPYSNNYSKLFEDMKGKILTLSKKKLDIQHVGSTSVPGLGGKGIIDLQVGINKWSEASEIAEILKQLGFKHFHAIENHNLFVSTKTICNEGDFHIHICRKHTKRYNGTLAFRDFLRNNPKEAKKYEELKIALFKQVGDDRKLFKKLKNDYFNKITNTL